MIATVCTNFTQRFLSMINISARFAFPVSLSRVLSVRFPAHDLFSKTSCRLHASFMSSVHLATAAGSLRGQNATRRVASVCHSWLSWPVSVRVHQRLRQRSTSAAPDAFPKRGTRRTKKKDIEHRSHVNVALIVFVFV